MLQAAWQDANTSYLKGQLRRPLIMLADSGSRLGWWEPLTRTIHVSVDHMIDSHWIEVELTLRHEMAHQVVTEIFGAHHAPPHGELFRRAHRMLGIDHSPHLDRPSSPREDKVISRVQKLMNLARSHNRNEAQAAMAAANRLLLKYNIEIHDTQSPPDLTYCWVGRPLRRIPLENKILSGILQDHFFVQTIWVGTRDMRTTRPARILELVGRRHNIDIARYVHEYLGRTLDNLWKAYQKGLSAGPQKRTARRDYRLGLLLGFREHLASQQKRHKEEGLIWWGDPGIDELMDRRYPSRSRLGGGSYRLSEAHKVGVKDGRSIRIRKGLSDEAPVERGRMIGSKETKR